MKSIKFSKTNIVDKDIKLVGKIIKSGDKTLALDIEEVGYQEC